MGAPEAVRLPEAWTAQGDGLRIWAAGTGLAAYPALKDALAGVLEEARDDLLPSAADIARLAVPEVMSGRLQPAEEALPVYLRDEVDAFPRKGSH